MPRIKALLVGVNAYTRRPLATRSAPIDTDRPWSAVDVDEVMAMLERIQGKIAPATPIPSIAKRPKVVEPVRLLRGNGIEVLALLDSQETTLTGIRKGLDWLFRGSAIGDVLLFYFSGHGTLVRNGEVGGIPRFDEVLLTSDTDWHPEDPVCLKDDEIGTRHTSQAWLEVVLETCSAASFDGGDRPKIIRQFGCFYGGTEFPAGSGAVWAATQAECSAYSAAVDPQKPGLIQGLFTHFLCEGLPDHLFRKNSRNQLLGTVAGALADCAQRRAEGHCSPFHQIPELHCVADDRGRPPLVPGKPAAKPAQAFKRPDECPKHV